MRRRLKPYGKTLPIRGHFRAWLLGVRDGWAQPFELSTSFNVDHLETGDGQVCESLDRGINAGQWLRSPFNHQQPEVD